jgi:two-component system sensor histidine kinase/response regulator
MMSNTLSKSNLWCRELVYGTHLPKIAGQFFSNCQRSVRVIFLILAVGCLLTTACHPDAEAAEPSRQGTPRQEVLILNSYHPGYSWSDDEQAGIVDVFREKDKDWLPVIEYLDLKRLPDGRHLAELKKLFRLKYQKKKLSVVIAMDNGALDFAIDNQAELFWNAPIVFCGISNYNSSLLKGHTEVTGIIEAIDIAGTIEVMLRLHPATQEIFCPHDYTVTGLALRKELEALVPRFGKVRFRFTDPLTMEELFKELERLPKDSLVLPLSFITDKSGRTFDVSETTKLFYEHSSVPIYSTFKQRLGFGIVGGKLLSPRVHGAHAGRIALRVLAGEKASAIPVVFKSDAQFMFDYKVMSRFGIPLSALPEGSTVINKPVSFYATHRAVIQVALGVGFFLIVIIFLLTINIIQRKRSSEVIRRSEELFKVITSSNPDHILIQDGDLRYSFVMNPQMGLTEQEMIGKTDYDLTSKEDADKLTEIKRQVVNTGLPVHVVVPLTSLKGEQQIFEGSYIPKFDAKGQVDGLIGYFKNITERRRAEEELRERKEFTENLIASMQDGFSVLDSHGIQIDVNPAFCQMTGFSREELIEVGTPHCYWPPEAYEEIEKAFQKTLRGDFGDVELTFMRKNGERFPVIVSPSWVKDKQGNVTSYFATVKDITERKQAEEEKRRLEERSRKVVEDIFRFIPEGVLVFSRKMELLRQNQAFRELVSGYAKRLGFAEDELENLIVDKIKATMGDKNIKEIRISKKRETGGQT